MNKEYEKYVIERFKELDRENYDMYFNNGLSDSEIVEIVTSWELEKLYGILKDYNSH